MGKGGFCWLFILNGITINIMDMIVLIFIFSPFHANYVFFYLNYALSPDFIQKKYPSLSYTILVWENHEKKIDKFNSIDLELMICDYNYVFDQKIFIIK